MKKTKYLAGFVLFAACVANFSPNYSQYQLSPLASQLMEMFSMTPSQFSSIFTAVMMPAIFLSLVAGILADRFGLKRVVGFGLGFTALGTCLRIFAGSYGTLVVFMFMTGIGATLLNANGAKFIGSYFPPEKNVTMMSIFQAAATLAMAVAMGTTSLFPSVSSAFVFAAGISLAALILWLVFARDPKQEASAGVAELPRDTIAEAMRIVVRNKYVWLTAFCLMGIITSATAMNAFLPTALAERGIDAVQAGVVASFMTIGNLCGCLAVPFIANRLGKNKPVLAACAIIAAVGSAFAWRAPEGPLLIASLFLTGACLSGMVPLLMPIPVQIKEIGPLYGGTAGGFVTTIQLLGVVLLPTYVLTPLAGGNMTLYYLLCGLCVCMSIVTAFFLPEFGRKAISK
ncbi:MFS transporter [Eubacterium sp. 1001713B170207_170306_E7]|uniref:MFS transporter n=1 Tax=Eubacterium sp. 1001713B170207_170306_E7 TaxID=2787097 RepID=UPI00189A3CC7|nr:MFS transporter [Eubacterium sp. 1001713B170207_170306_E7]